MEKYTTFGQEVQAYYCRHCGAELWNRESFSGSEGLASVSISGFEVTRREARDGAFFGSHSGYVLKYASVWLPLALMRFLVYSRCLYDRGFFVPLLNAITKVYHTLSLFVKIVIIINYTLQAINLVN